MTWRIVGRNATLFRQGEPASKIYAVRQGWLQAIHLMPNGKAVTDLHGPGSLLGIDCAAGNITYPFTAVALAECEIEEACSTEFLGRLQNDPLIAIDVLRYVSRNMERIRNLFFATASKVRSSERLMETLREISLNCSTVLEGGNVRVNVPLPVQVLADRIGCSRQWASKLLKDLEKSGVLRRTGVWVTFSQRSLDSYLDGK
jgi:CRP-like cAMP-binding protein